MENIPLKRAAEKLVSLMEGLEISDIAEFLIKSGIDDYRKLGEEIKVVTKEIISSQRNQILEFHAKVDAFQKALQHIYDIVTEKDRNNEDLGIGSTAMKSVISWSKLGYQNQIESVDLPRLAGCRVHENGNDYVVDIARPNGSIVTVLIPVETTETWPCKVVEQNDLIKPFGLNLVSDGHYY